jgi:amino acid transporter
VRHDVAIVAGSLVELLFGRPLRTDEQDEQRIGAARGIPVLGLDALSSAAYGPEAALTVLIPLGAAATIYIAPISAVIILVLATVYFSYRQTIEAYPGGGGSYTVASQNLGAFPGLLAASALGLDYILNVAVAISAGVGAIVSAAPGLLQYTLPLCLGILVLLTIINLRGIRETGLLFLAPTYLFVGSLAVVITVGVVRTLLSHGHPTPAVPPPTPGAATEAVSAWLLLRAFASGTTAMTGVEAVSNGVPLFRDPSVKTANRALTAIIGILVALLVGIAILCRAYGIAATPPATAGYESVLSQLTRAVVGKGMPYYVTMASVVTVLCLSANTSFADFPRLGRVLALDRYLPMQFAHPGRRLVYTTGILLLSSVAAVLLIVFKGVTDRLIPLFAVGALLAFSMSQWGMVAHWRRVGGPKARHSLAANAVGAVATSITTLVVIISKFTEGAWVTLIVIAAFICIFLVAHHSHERVEHAIRGDMSDTKPLDVNHLVPPIVIVPLRGLDRVARKGLRFALSISPDVQAVLVITDDANADASCATNLATAWHSAVDKPVASIGHRPVELIVLPSHFREFFTPFLRHVRAVCAENPYRYVAVVVPEVVERRWYDVIFASHRPAILKTGLRLFGGPRVLVIDAPWHIGDTEMGATTDLDGEQQPPIRPDPMVPGM